MGRACFGPAKNLVHAAGEKRSTKRAGTRELLNRLLPVIEELGRCPINGLGLASAHPVIGVSAGCGSAARRQLMAFVPGVGLPQSRGHAAIEVVGNRIPIPGGQSVGGVVADNSSHACRQIDPRKAAALSDYFVLNPTDSVLRFTGLVCPLSNESIRLLGTLRAATSGVQLNGSPDPTSTHDKKVL